MKSCEEEILFNKDFKRNKEIEFTNVEVFICERSEEYYAAERAEKQLDKPETKSLRIELFRLPRSH